MKVVLPHTTYPTELSCYAVISSQEENNNKIEIEQDGNNYMQTSNVLGLKLYAILSVFRTMVAIFVLIFRDYEYM